MAIAIVAMNSNNLNRHSSPRRTMINWTTFKQLMKPALLVALMAGMSLLATSAMLVSQEGDSHSGGTGDHGDNPVVGSLPCLVDPELDLMFGGNATSGMFPTATLGLTGSTALSSQVLDADGVPFGLVNRGGFGIFTIFGLVNNGSVTVSRLDASKGFMQLRQWVPDSYIGGTISMASTVGNPSRTIAGNVIELPMIMVASAPGPFVDARITIKSPNSTMPNLVVYITAVGDLLSVTYAP